MKAQRRIGKPVRFMSQYPKAYAQYARRAISKGITFDLTVRTFNDIRALPCFYCGEDGGTIDRKDSTKGYTIQNSLPCCKICNMMKWTATIPQFLAQVQKISNHTK